jgi:hypothetical protein
MKTYIHVWSHFAQFLEWEMFQTSIVEKIKTHILCSIYIFLNLAIYEITRKNVVDPNRPPITIWHMHIACLIPKTTNTHSEYVALIAFPMQHWLYVCISLLHYTYNASPVCNFCSFQGSYTNWCWAYVTQLVYSTLTVDLRRHMKVTKQSTKSKPIHKWAMHDNWSFREYLLLSKMCCRKITAVQCEWDWGCLELLESSDNANFSCF